MALQTAVIGPAYTLSKWSVAEFGPYVVQFARAWLTAIVFLAVVLVLRRGRLALPALTAPEWWRVAGIALLGIGVNQFCYTLGLVYTTPGNSSLIYALTPMAVLFLAAFVVRTERLTSLKISGVLVALAGVLMVFLSLGKTFESQYLTGNLITVVALCCWSIYIVLSRKVLHKFDTLTGTAVIMVLGAAWFTPVGALPAWDFDYAAVSSRAWLGLFNLVIVNSTVSFLLLNYALRGLQSSQVAIYNNIQPIPATLFSIAVGAEARLSGLFLIGAAVVLVGILLLNLARRRDELKRAAALRTHSH